MRNYERAIENALAKARIKNKKRNDPTDIHNIRRIKNDKKRGASGVSLVKRSK